MLGPSCLPSVMLTLLSPACNLPAARPPVLLAVFARLCFSLLPLLAASMFPLACCSASCLVILPLLGAFLASFCFYLLRFCCCSVMLALGPFVTWFLPDFLLARVPVATGPLFGPCLLLGAWTRLSLLGDACFGSSCQLVAARGSSRAFFALSPRSIRQVLFGV